MVVDDIAALTGPGYVIDSVLHRPEPLVVRPTGPVDPDPDTAAAVAGVLRQAPTVTVVEGRPDHVPAVLAEAADVCLTDRPGAPRPWVTGGAVDVETAVAGQPLAAVALVSLLRSTVGAGVWEAVVAEAATYGMVLGSAAHRAWLDQRGEAEVRPTTRPPVAVERRGDMLVIVLDRPEVRNAIDTTMRDALVEALAVATADPSVTGVSLAGAGPCFSAGGDLTEFGTVADGATAFTVRLGCHPGLALHRVADRVTAHVHGACVGAGVEIPAFAGRVHAAPDTTFRLPELAMGLVPGAGGTVSIARRVGRQRLAWMALTGQPLDAPTALDWGLVDRIEG
ncbi:MAG TPA: enoyl-CoA hydratase/isomerase family protein [Iamia sp.]